MRVLLLGSKEYPALFRSEACGGIEVHVEAIVKRLLTVGVEVFIVTRLLPNVKMVESRGKLHVYRVPSLGAKLLRTFTFNLSSFLLSIYLIAKYNIQLIHANDFTSGFFSGILKLSLRRPLLLSAPTFGSKQPEWPHSVKAVLLGFERFSLMTSDFAFVFVPSDIEYVCMRYGISRRKVAFLGNGVDVERFEKAKGSKLLGRTRLPEGVKVIMFIGRLTRSKGLQYLIRAFRRVADETESALLIVGDGTEKKHLYRIVKETELESRIIFLGRCLNVENLLAIADVFVLPSLYEGFPIALVEAMASKKPVISTRVGAAPFIIEDEVDGFLIEPGDVDQLSHAILRVLSDRELCEKVSERACRKVKERYSWDSICEKIYAVYKRLTES